MAPADAAPAPKLAPPHSRPAPEAEPVVATPPPPPAPPPRDAYDGSYAGTMTLSRNGGTKNRPCVEGPLNREVTVKGGQFLFVFAPDKGITIGGDIKPDGTASGFGATPQGGVRFNGQIANGQFTATADSANGCGYTLQLRKQG